ncbi:hypothetical protein M3586_29810, partial [Priestia megaterium]|nr:hypothetical protein [Priestia megaterium]
LDAVDCAQPWLATRRAKLLFALGQACERRADWDAALDAYTRSAWPGSRHRRIRVLERCGRDDDALALALAARGGFGHPVEYVGALEPRGQARVGRQSPREVDRLVGDVDTGCIRAVAHEAQRVLPRVA